MPVDGLPEPVPVRIGSPADAPFTARLTTEVSRRPLRLMAACLATVLGSAVVAHAGSARPSSTTDGARLGRSIAAPAPLPAPAAGDPSTWRVVAQVAADTCPGLPATVLVAIGQVESSLGLQTFQSPAGAQGPMQFLPATWAAYGADGDGDGQADVMNVADALHGAARLLCANGGADAGRLPGAIWNYNHSDDYVVRVLSLARPGTPTRW